MRTLFLLVAVLVASRGALGQEIEIKTPPDLTGDKTLVKQKFVYDRAPVPTVASEGTHPGYASINYALGLLTDRQAVIRTLNYIADALSADLGNKEGTYTITVTVSDLNGNALARSPIVSFQWTKSSGFLFVENTVSEVQKTNWKGTPVNQILMSSDNRKIKIGVEVYLHHERSLDFEFLKKTASAGALAAGLPLPAATSPIVDSLTALINSLYMNNKQKDLVETDDFDLETTKKPIRSSITIRDKFGQTFPIPLYITIETQSSRLVPGSVIDGRFDKRQISETIFNNATIPMGDGKNVTVVELISTANNDNFRNARPMLAALASGGTYGKEAGKEDITGKCGSLYDALNVYFSFYDARAMFWAFLRRYADKIDKQACLGQGERSSELSAVGLDP